MKKYLLALSCVFTSLVNYGQNPDFPESLKLSDYKPNSVFKLQEDQVKLAAYPVTDMHSHAYVDNVEDIQQWLKQYLVKLAV